MMRNLKKTVVVGMSGGVDSSVTALLLKQQGYQVIGMFMKNWEEEGHCPAAQDYEDVVAVCHHLDIPYYTVNFSKPYWDLVFTPCLEEYKLGLTPNPDILCNREIKFHVFLEKALEIGADYLATGHYAQVIPHQEGPYLGRGIDPDKDQSYFLYTLKSSILEKVLFPLGDLTKKEVRSFAEEYGLPNAKKRDSTGICFIGKRDFKDFLSGYIQKEPGNFETSSGKIVGRHDGLPYYTIGQRRGLGIGGPGEAWFVVGKDPQRNVILVEQGDDHPALYHQHLLASQASWVAKPPLFPIQCSAKIRYRSADVLCQILGYEGDMLKVVFETPQKAITPKQSIVFYHERICLGGAIIEKAI